MCVNIALGSLVIILVYKMPTYGSPSVAIKNQENNLKFGLIVPGDAWRPQDVRLFSGSFAYPNAVARTSVTLNNPAAVMAVSSHKPLLPSQPYTSSSAFPKNVFSEQSSPTGIQASLWENVFPIAEPSTKPSTAIQPLGNDHYNPAPILPPTYLFPLQSLSTTTISGPPMPFSPFFTSSSLMSGYNSEGTPSRPLDLGLLHDSIFKEDKEGDFSLRDEHGDKEYEDVSDVNEDALAKIEETGNMFEYYAPVSLLKNILREDSPERARGTRLFVSGKPAGGEMNKIEGDDKNPELFKELRKRLNLLQDMITAERRTIDVEKEIEEMHGSDYFDVPEEPETDTSHLTQLIGFSGKIVPKYQEKSDSAEKFIKDSISEYTKDPNPWNTEYTKSIWNDDASNSKTFPESTDAVRSGEPDANKNKKTRRFTDMKHRHANNDKALIEDRLIRGRSDLIPSFKESMTDAPPVKIPNKNFNSYHGLELFDETYGSTNHAPKSAIPMSKSTSSQTTPITSLEQERVIGLKDYIGTVLGKGNWGGDFTSNEAGSRNLGTTKDTDKRRSRTIKEEDINDSGGHENENVASGSERLRASVPYDPTVSEERSPTKPVCKEVHDIGLAKNGLSNETQLSHTRNLVCIKDYDEDDDKDEDRSFSNEIDMSAEMAREEHSREMSAENDNEFDDDFEGEQ